MKKILIIGALCLGGLYLANKYPAQVKEGAEELKAVGKRIKRAIAPETNDNQDKAPVSPETKPSREIPEAGWAEAAGDTVKVNAAPAPVEPKITPEEEERLFWEPIGGKPE